MKAVVACVSLAFSCGDDLRWIPLEIDESRHAKPGLKIFVVVIPKESLAGSSPAKPYFGKHQ